MSEMVQVLRLHITEKVRVKLTDEGRRIYAPNEKLADADGWSTFQLDELMSLFGRHLHRFPFAGTIEIPLDD